GTSKVWTARRANTWPRQRPTWRASTRRGFAQESRSLSIEAAKPDIIGVADCRASVATRPQPDLPNSASTGSTTSARAAPFALGSRDGAGQVHQAVRGA